MNIKTCLIFFSILFISSAYGEDITIPVNAEECNLSKPVNVSVKWNDSWFTNYNPKEYHHDIARIACILSEVSYVPESKDPTFTQVRNVYKALGVPEENMEFNYHIDYNQRGIGINQVALSFAHKTINTSKGKGTLVFVTIRGTPQDASEWISNINVSDSSHSQTKIHEGFYQAETEVHKAFIYYLLKNSIKPDTAYFLITGHSRGAAVSNLFSAQLADEGLFNTNQIFTYTFAAPNVSTEDKVHDSKYDFIWNIINSEDIVPTVPMRRNKWKYNKYGQVKVFANYWNTDPDVFENNYIPRINDYFTQFMSRPYYPFNVGSYIPSIITRIITNIYPDVKYYYGRFGLRKFAEKVFYKVFDNKEEKQKSVPAFVNHMTKVINKKTDGFADYAQFAFFDMHICTTYLSWMLGLNEDEIFSDVGSSRILIKGNYECAVFDSKGETTLRILDGIPEVDNFKSAVVGFPSHAGVFIGLPSNQEYKVVIYKNSMLPTSIPIRIDHFTAEGYEEKIERKKRIYPWHFKSYSFKAGNITLCQETIDPEVNRYKDTRRYVKEGKMLQDTSFFVQPQFSLNTDLNFEGGVRYGSRAFHGETLTSTSLTSIGKAANIDIGFGHEQCLVGSTMIGLDIYARNVWALGDIEEDQSRYNFVPEVRLTLSHKPFRTNAIFVQGVFDFHIEDFNDAAFLENVTKKNLGHIDLDKVNLVPSIRFGLRL